MAHKVLLHLEHDDDRSSLNSGIDKFGWFCTKVKQHGRRELLILSCKEMLNDRI